MKNLYILFENRYESVQAMQVLVNDIIFYFAKKNYPLIKRYMKSRDVDDIYFNEDIASIKEITQGENLSKYGILQDFIKSWGHLSIFFKSNLKLGKTTIGYFSSGRSFLNGRAGRAMNPKVVLRYNVSDMVKLIDSYLRTYEGEEIDRDKQYRILRSAIGVVYRSILLHELRHAYDDWRSNAKYHSDKKSNTYYSRLKKHRALDEKDRDSKIDDELHNIKLSLPHEYWARFDQAIHDLQGRLHKPFRQLVNDFKIKLRGWNTLNEKDQRKLLKAFYIYHSMENKKE